MTTLFLEDYNRISSLTSSISISNALKKMPAEFIVQYKKHGNNLRGRKYRESNKETINTKRKEYNKLRKPSRPIKHIITPLDLETVDKAKPRPETKPRSVLNLKEASKTHYIIVMKSIYEKYNKEKLSDDSNIVLMLKGKNYNAQEIFNDFGFLNEKIEEIASNYKGYVGAIYSVFCMFKTVELMEIRDKIYPYFMAVCSHYRQHRGDYEIDNIEVAKISFEKEHIITIANNLYNPYDKLLYLLLFLLPTRRLSDYRNMLIATDESQLNDKSNNYYYKDKLYIYNTKNKKEVIQDISDYTEIIEIIDSLEEPKYILGKEYKSATLSNIFNRLTFKIYGACYGACDIRKLSATASFNRIKSNEDMERFKEEALLRGHSTSEALEYIVYPEI